MPTATTRQVRLAERPTGLPGPGTWEITDSEVPAPGEGEVVVRVRLLSVDPAMRGMLRDRRSYAPPVAVGEVMRAEGVGDVVASRVAGLPVGTTVTGRFGVQEHAVAAGGDVRPVDVDAFAAEAWLGVLGMTGMTAYFGLLEVGALRTGETVVVSGAAGAVGSVAGQIAKLRGCRVIGIAGGGEKCRWLEEELGFDAAIDYREADVAAALAEHAPDGIDVYFDNVGGDVLDAALTRLARGARVVLCGAISQYNEDRMRGPANYMSLLVTRSRMEGFLVFDYADRYPEAVAALGGWLADGSLTARETVVDGSIEDFGATLLRLFRGENTGKLLLRVA